MTTQHLTHRSIVQAQECNEKGSMNKQVYMNKFFDANLTFLSMIGLDKEYMQRTKVSPSVVNPQAQYQKRCFEGESLAIHSHIVKAGGKQIQFDHVMTNALTGDEVAKCCLTSVLVDSSEPPKALYYPEEIMEKVKDFL